MRAFDLCVLQAEIQFLLEHPLIANFIGPKSKLGFMEPSPEALNYEITLGKLIFRDFF